MCTGAVTGFRHIGASMSSRSTFHYRESFRGQSPKNLCCDSCRAAALSLRSSRHGAQGRLAACRSPLVARPLRAPTRLPKSSTHVRRLSSARRGYVAQSMIRSASCAGRKCLAAASHDEQGRCAAACLPSFDASPALLLRSSSIRSVRA